MGDVPDFHDADWPDDFEREPGLLTRLLSSRAAWLLVAAVGLIVFELTADPALGILVGCLKYGWDELWLARQLRRLDSETPRGRVCARFYEAYALWKVSLVGFGVMLLVLVIEGFIVRGLRPPGRPGPGGAPREFVTAGGIVLVGFTIAALVSLVAVIGAQRGRIRVWVGRRHNRLKLILLSVLLFWGTPVLVLTWCLLTLGAQHLGLMSLPVLVMSMVLFVALFFVALPMVLLVLVDRLASQIAAECPSDCWPELRLPADERPKFLSLLQVRPVTLS